MITLYFISYVQFHDGISHPTAGFVNKSSDNSISDQSRKFVEIRVINPMNYSQLSACMFKTQEKWLKRKGNIKRKKGKIKR
jgi:hypothetical protein